ncbi:MAG: HAD family phosphatase [Verrucomicrobiota bacterium]|jgi:beta-phosphoglucomutase family hydrolase
MPLQALIFDCDGTLADSMPLHWRAWKQMTESHGLHFSEDRFYSLGGVPARDIVKLLSKEQGRAIDYEAVAKEKELAFEQLIPQVRVVGLIAKIARDHSGRLPMAVASGGTRRIVTQMLHHLGIEHLFQAVVVSEDVARQKPAPDIYLEAARRLGVAPQNCRAYEDTDLGLAAIRAAGMEAVDVRPMLAAG